MYEIELKAHVYDRENLVRTLNSFAGFRGTLSKTDRYWSLGGAGQKDAAHGAAAKQNAPSVRIRCERIEADGEKSVTRTIVTVKQKNIVPTHTQGNARDSLEVNDEKEFTVSDAGAFEDFITQAGFSPVLTKRKTCMQWRHENILIELCTVEHLGDFLELEILSPECTAAHVKTARIQLENLLKKCNIPLAQIEPMYYSELLQRINEV